MTIRNLTINKMGVKSTSMFLTKVNKQIMENQGKKSSSADLSAEINFWSMLAITILLIYMAI